MAYKVMLAGGGTGGHVAPLVAVAQELQSAGTEGIKMKFIGSGPLLKQEARNLGLKYSIVTAPKWRRYFSISNFLGILLVPVAFVQSFISVWIYMPDVMFAKGGFASFWPLLCARLLFIPIVIHESDAVPGRVNRFFNKFAKKIFVAFEESRAYFNTQKVELVGNPVRSSTIAIVPKEEALSQFGFGSQKPTIFVTGASQGAKILNEVVLLALLEILKKYNVIHQSGPKLFDDISKRVSVLMQEQKKESENIIESSYRLFPTLTSQQMSLAYSACDLVISRASSTIFEIAAVGKPAILVPLAGAANNHQFENANAFAGYGAIVIVEANLKPHLLLNEINKAYENRTALGPSIRRAYVEHSARRIADYLLKFE